MKNADQDGVARSQGKFDKRKNKNAELEKKPHEESGQKTGQQKFISDTEETENLIDPGNEHHHHADEVDKHIGQGK
ncbi:MAG: hypothetical protein ABI419_07555 [Ginsengibacter sp.]